MYNLHLSPISLVLLAWSVQATVVSASFASESAADAAPADGKTLYAYNCSACHLPDGKGIPNLAPALNGNPLLARDPALLIQIVLKGPATVLPSDRTRFGGNTMDSFYYKLDDDQVAAILTYIRQDFVKGEGGKARPVAVTPKEVAAARAKIDPEKLNN